MGSFEKLIKKIKTLNKNLRFEELKKVLEDMGYEGRQPQKGSSHWTFRKKAHDPITVPNHEPIKVVYVKEVKYAIEKYEDELEKEKNKEEN